MITKVDGFEWDDGNWPKCEKHGVSKGEIEGLFSHISLIVAPDIKHSTIKEKRYIAAGKIGGRAVFVAFSVRGNKIRPISARYMHKKEAMKYETSS